MVVLAVGAHPDDIEFGCYGTLGKLRERNEIHSLIFSAGELGGPRRSRVQEARRSARLIRAHLQLLDYPDGGILVNPETLNLVSEQIKRLQPDIVFTLFPNDSHQDHKAVSAITPNYFFDITKQFDLKKRALLCYRTQAGKPYLDIDEVQGLARYRAYQCRQRNRLFNFIRPLSFES